MVSIVAEPDDASGRDQALLGTYLAATAFASAGSGMHHKICHVLGGTYGLPHAETHVAPLEHAAAGGDGEVYDTKQAAVAHAQETAR